MEFGSGSRALQRSPCAAEGLRSRVVTSVEFRGVSVGARPRVPINSVLRRPRSAAGGEGRDGAEVQQADSEEPKYLAYSSRVHGFYLCAFSRSIEFLLRDDDSEVLRCPYCFEVRDYSYFKRIE